MIRVLVTSLILSFIAAQPTPAALFDTLTDIGISAQHIARGNIEGFSTGANSIFENPAGLYRVNAVSFSFFTTQFINEVNFNSFAVAFRTPFGTIAGGYLEGTVTDIPETTENGSGFFVPSGAFNFKNTHLQAGLQTEITEYISIGFSYAHYIKSFQNIKGTGGNISAGGILNLGFLEGSVFGRNLIPRKLVTFNNGGHEALATEIVTSVRLPIYDFNLFGQLTYKRQTVYPSTGLKYQPHWLPFAHLSAGFRQYLVIDEVRSNWTYGLGLTLYGIEFYLAQEVSDHPLQNHKNYFSVNLNLK